MPAAQVLQVRRVNHKYDLICLSSSCGTPTSPHDDLSLLAGQIALPPLCRVVLVQEFGIRLQQATVGFRQFWCSNPGPQEQRPRYFRSPPVAMLVLRQHPGCVVMTCRHMPEATTRASFRGSQCSTAFSGSGGSWTRASAEAHAQWPWRGHTFMFSSRGMVW